MLAILSTGDASFLVALIALLGGGGWWQSRKNGRQLDQINRAVNHVTDDDPAPLISRVRYLEADSKWKTEVLILCARQLGVDVPPPPKKEEIR